MYERWQIRPNSDVAEVIIALAEHEHRSINGQVLHLLELALEDHYPEEYSKIFPKNQTKKPPDPPGGAAA